MGPTLGDGVALLPREPSFTTQLSCCQCHFLIAPACRASTIRAMRNLGFPGAIAVAAAGWLGLCSARVMATPVGAGPLVWSDEFNGTAVDPKKWTCNEP